jgi:hypothetical protein
MVEHTKQRPLLRVPWRLHPPISPAPCPAMGRIGIGRSLGSIPEQAWDIASRGLLLQEPVPQADSVDRICVLPAFEAVPRRRQR